MASSQRPAHRRPLSRLTGGSTLSAVIAEYLRAADGDRREVRAALSHADAELGTMAIGQIRSRNVAALLDDLTEAGLSARRQAAVVDALRGLFAFAVARGLIDGDPTPGRRRAVPASTQPAPKTPTLTMLALGARVAFWTTWAVVVGFLGLLVALLFEFG